MGSWLRSYLGHSLHDFIFFLARDIVDALHLGPDRTFFELALAILGRVCVAVFQVDAAVVANVLERLRREASVAAVVIERARAVDLSNS